MIRLLYAVVPPAGGKAPGRGLGGERLRVIRAGGIAALVGELPSPPRPAAQTLRAYHDVIVDIGMRHAAVIPVRFGTVIGDDEELMFILRSRAASFRRLLTRVRGRAQMTVRFVSHAPVADVAPPVPASSSGGAEYLRLRAASYRRWRELPLVRQLHAAAGIWIRGERIEHRHQVVTVYHLVPRAMADRYRRAVARIVAPGGLQVSGPFPPFAFADPFDLDVAFERAKGHTHGPVPHG